MVMNSWVLHMLTYNYARHTFSERWRKPYGGHAPQQWRADDNVGLTSSELVVNGILQVDNVEASVVALTVSDDTDTTHVTTTGNHDNDTSVELDEVGDLASGEVDLDGVVDLDGGVGVADSTQKF
jgi:hypothetical protein